MGQYNLLKENIEKTVEDFNQKNIEVQNITTSSLKEYFDEIKKSIDELPEVKYYDRQIIELRKEVKEIESLKTIVEELKDKQSLLNENVIDAPPSEDNSDPLTPLDQNFVTLDELQDHYRLFVNRIQQQLSSLGGGGEVRVLRMDDVAINDLTASGDGTFTGNVTAVDGTFSGNVSIAGTLTYEDVTNVDAVGLITARDGIKVGSGITLSVDGDGFYTGVVTATTFVGNLTGNPTGSGANLTNLPAANITGTLPAISGANLTNLDASDLASGTIPDARFPATLPAVSGANLTGIAVGVATTVATGISGITTVLDLSNDDHKITVSGITTVDVRGGTEGDSHSLRIINSGITTVGFSTYFLFPSGAAPNIPTADGTLSMISFTVHRQGVVGLATQLFAGASVNFS